VNILSTILKPCPRGDEIMAPRDVLMGHYVQECAAARKLIDTILWDEKDVIFVTVTLKREEFRMLVFIQFVPQENQQMYCVTTPGQCGECAPLSELVWRMLPLSSCSLYVAPPDFHPF
jgi:hypothetical protein